MQMMVKPNLYASLDMIPQIGTNRSTQWSKQHSKRSPTSYISQNDPKGSETVQNYRKGVKIFKRLKNVYK